MYTKERNEKVARGLTKRWQDPEYRKRMIEKQRSIGLRTYGMIGAYNTTKYETKKK